MAVGGVEEVEVGVGEGEVEAEGAEGGPRDEAQRCLVPSQGEEESRIRATTNAGGVVVEARAALATITT